MSFASLSIKDLGASYGTQRILKNLSLTLENDPALVITGPSGCGKSTLLKICAGILPCTEGNVTLSMPDGKRPHAAMVPQGGVLMPWKNVYDNLALPLKIQKSDHREDKIVRMLAELELTGLEKRFPHELSGGQRQRLCLGQALIGDPEILFLDEPFSACDTMLKEKLQLFLKKLLMSAAGRNPRSKRGDLSCPKDPDLRISWLWQIPASPQPCLYGRSDTTYTRGSAFCSGGRHTASSFKTNAPC